MERVCYLTNKIYREMLGITRDENISYITIRGVQVSAFSWARQYEIVLSRDLLSWISMKDGRIPSSFTDFITCPVLSGPLYISPDIYHTQITEYLLTETYHQ